MHVVCTEHGGLGFKLFYRNDKGGHELLIADSPSLIGCYYDGTPYGWGNGRLELSLDFVPSLLTNQHVALHFLVGAHLLDATPVVVNSFGDLFQRVGDKV